jgi:hypothetical protein
LVVVGDGRVVRGERWHEGRLERGGGLRRGCSCSKRGEGEGTRQACKGARLYAKSSLHQSKLPDLEWRETTRTQRVEWDAPGTRRREGDVDEESKEREEKIAVG